MPKVSVVCCFYRRPLSVRRTLLGLRNQAFQDFEAIISDDGSGDETPDVIRQTLAEFGDARFRYIERRKNVGLTRGLIESISVAQGEYIAIHDAGDVSLPARLREQTALLDSQPDVVVSGCHYVNYVETAGIYRIRTPDAGSRTIEELRVDSTYTHGEVMFRKAAYERAGGYRAEFRMSQDNDLWMRMLRLGAFATVPQTLYIRAVDFEGISFNHSTVARQSAYYVLGKKIATGEMDEVKVLDRLSSGEPILDVMPLCDPAVQRQIQKVAIRSAIFGAPSIGFTVANEYLEHTLKCQGLIWSLQFLNQPVGRSILPILRSALGMRSGIPIGWIDK